MPTTQMLLIIEEAGTRGRAPASVDNIQHLFCRVANIIHPQMAEKFVYTNLPVLAIASIETFD